MAGVKTASVAVKTRAKTDRKRNGTSTGDAQQEKTAGLQKDSAVNAEKTNRQPSSAKEQPAGTGKKKKSQCMSQELKGSETEKCLMEAYISEAKIWTKYALFAEKAKKDGYEKISSIFKTVSENELAHAGVWFKMLHDNAYQSTEINLEDSVKSEHTEHAELYAGFEKIARDEGFDEIADMFRQIGEIEKSHEERFRTELTNVKNQRVFKKKQKQSWVCRNCGNIHIGTEAPLVCSVCSYPKAYFEVKAE